MVLLFITPKNLFGLVATPLGVTIKVQSKFLTMMFFMSE